MSHAVIVTITPKRGYPNGSLEIVDLVVVVRVLQVMTMHIPVMVLLLFSQSYT
jgi:hypothetical protein